MFRRLPCFLLCLVLLSCARPSGRSLSAWEVAQINEQRSLAAVLVEHGDFARARDILTAVNSQAPGDPQTLAMLAWTQWKTGAASEAVSNFEASLRRDYTDYLTHLRFAQMLYKSGKTGRALAEFELAVRYGEAEPVTHYNYGLALYKLGRKDEALIEWQQAYDLDPVNPQYAEAIGMGFAGSDDRRALVYFEKADSLGWDSPSFRNNFAQLLQRLGDDRGAEREFLRAVADAPEDASYRFNLAAFYANKRRHEMALPIWERLVEMAPEQVSYRVYLARTLFELGRFDKAISMLSAFAARVEGSSPVESEDSAQGGGPSGSTREAAPCSGELAPAHASEAFDILAMSYRGKGDLERANLFIEKALEINPRSVQYLNNSGVILAERGMIDEARVQWQEVLEIEPGNEAARQYLSIFSR